MILNMQKLTLIGFLADKESILRDLMRKKVRPDRRSRKHTGL